MGGKNLKGRGTEGGRKEKRERIERHPARGSSPGLVLSDRAPALSISPCVFSTAPVVFSERIPPVVIDEPPGAVATLIPAHFHHTLFEILKNAFKATVESAVRRNLNNMPAVKVRVGADGLFLSSPSSPPPRPPGPLRCRLPSLPSSYPPPRGLRMSAPGRTSASMLSS